jgi:AraC-like DNA-binding protein
MSLALRTMQAMVRAAALRGLPALVTALGGDGTELLARFGIDAAALDSDDAVIGSADTARVLETAAAELECGDLGLLHRITLLLAGGSYGLRSVHLPHGMLAPVRAYTGFFGADVRFHQPAAILRVPQSLAQSPVPGGGNEVLRQVALDYLGSHFPPPGPAVADRVRKLLSQSLGSAPVDLASIARLTRTHPRTLQRQLAAEGKGFEDLLDDVRRAAAHRLITQTDVPLTQVTAMVGLAEQSALSRATRRWFGVSPRELRRRAS